MPNAGVEDALLALMSFRMPHTTSLPILASIIRLLACSRIFAHFRRNLQSRFTQRNGACRLVNPIHLIDLLSIATFRHHRTLRTFFYNALPKLWFWLPSISYLLLEKNFLSANLRTFLFHQDGRDSEPDSTSQVLFFLGLCQAHDDWPFSFAGSPGTPSLSLRIHLFGNYSEGFACEPSYSRSFFLLGYDGAGKFPLFCFKSNRLWSFGRYPMQSCRSTC